MKLAYAIISYDNLCWGFAPTKLTGVVFRSLCLSVRLFVCLSVCVCMGVYVHCPILSVLNAKRLGRFRPAMSHSMRQSFENSGVATDFRVGGRGHRVGGRGHDLKTTYPQNFVSPRFSATLFFRLKNYAIFHKHLRKNRKNAKFPGGRPPRL